MAAHSKGVTGKLLTRLLKAQSKRAELEKRLPFAEKLKILDQLISDRQEAMDIASETRRSRRTGIDRAPTLSNRRIDA